MAIVTLPFRILSLLLCLLGAGPMSTPAWALARPETRVGEIFSSPLKSASADRAQTLEPRRESRGCDYDLASGVCKYLYCHNNPVNGIDPSGESMLVDLTVATAIRASIAAFTAGAISTGFAKARGETWGAAIGHGLGVASTAYAAVASPAIGLTLLGSFAFQLATGDAQFDTEAKAQLVAGLGLAIIFKNPAYLTREREMVAMVNSLQRQASGNSTAPACIVLGTRDGLPALAREIGDEHLLANANWQTVFETAVREPTTRFSFKLEGTVEGLSGGLKEQILAAIKRQQGYTDWELLKLQEAGRLGEVYFYQNGKVVNNPFQRINGGSN